MKLFWSSGSISRDIAPFAPGDFEKALPKIKQWGRAGIIARVETMKVAEETIKANVPTVILDPEPRLVAKVPELGSVEISQKPYF